MIFQRGAPRAEAASRSELGTSSSMSSVVRMTTGMTRMASATPPAQAEKWPMRDDHDLVDEQADDDRRRRQQDVVDEADDRGEARIAAVFGHVGAGEDADRRADDDADDGQDEAADDGVGEAAGAARRRRVGGEDLERQAGDSRSTAASPG